LGTQKTERKTIRFSKELAKKIYKHAAAENKSFSETVEFCCYNYFSQAEEREEKWDIVLKRMVRMVTDIKRLKEDVMFSIASVDGLARYFFALSPEIPKEEQQSANAASARRYKIYVDYVINNVRAHGGLLERVVMEKKTADDGNKPNF